MKNYTFKFLRKGLVLGTEVVQADSVTAACKKADAILKAHPRRCDDWQLENPLAKTK